MYYNYGSSFDEFQNFIQIGMAILCLLFNIGLLIKQTSFLPYDVDCSPHELLKCVNSIF